jgi:predicted metal-dependent HD superfamily phosphohydrolase
LRSERIVRAWDEACWALGIRARSPARDALIARWSEPHRHYHDLTHLDACLIAFDEHRALVAHPGEVLAALLFHDAVYEPTRSDNEARSADLARSMLDGASVESLDRIVRAIEATRTHEAGGDSDIALVLDVDLSILGADPETYDAFERAIRLEYAHVPDALFAVGRRAVLESFAQRDRIYATDEFHHALEARARANLARALTGSTRRTC